MTVFGLFFYCLIFVLSGYFGFIGCFFTKYLRVLVAEIYASKNYVLKYSESICCCGKSARLCHPVIQGSESRIRQHTTVTYSI